MSEAQPFTPLSASTTTRQRDITIDILRGVAVITMIAANLSAKALAEPHPLWLRTFGSFAAPLFVLLAGMMIPETHWQKKRNFGHFVLRGLIILAGGVLIDVWFEGIIPFTSMDVLYLIGLSLPLGYLCLRFPASLRWILALVIFAITPVLHHYLGYTEYPTEYYLRGVEVEESRDAKVHTSIIQHLFQDGWFPLVPWFGFVLIGMNLAGLRWRDGKTRSFATLPVLGFGLMCTAAGIVLGLTIPGRLLTRGGYSELFYPPTVWYLILACGVIPLLFWGVDSMPRWSFLSPVIVLGQTAFFICMLHRGIIAFAISDAHSRNSMAWFLSLYVGLLAVCVACGYGFRWGRKALKEMLA